MIKVIIWKILLFFLYPFLKVFDNSKGIKYDKINYYAELFILVLGLGLLGTWIEVIPALYYSIFRDNNFNVEFKVISVSLYTYYIALIPSFYHKLPIQKNNSYFYFFTLVIAIFGIGSIFLPEDILFYGLVFNIFILYMSIGLWTYYNINEVRFDIEGFQEQFRTGGNFKNIR